jgi:hypothetical protein
VGIPRIGDRFPHSPGGLAPRSPDSRGAASSRRPDFS